MVRIAAAAILACVIVAAESPSYALLSADEQEQVIRAALDRGAYDEAETRAASWRDSVELTPEPHPIELARALDLYAEALLKNGKAAEQRTSSVADRALQLKEAALGPKDVEVATSLHNRAAVHYSRGEFTAALTLQERALDLTRSTIGPTTSEYADRLDAAAQTLIDLNKLDRAQGLIQQSLPIRERQSAEFPLAYARTLELSARVDREAGRYAPAADALDRALKLWNREAPAHPDKAIVLTMRALALFQMGEVVPASGMWSDAYALSKRTLRPGHPSIALVARLAANGPFALGSLAEARRLREEAQRIGEQALTPCHPEVRAELNDLAISHQSDGDYDGASKLYRRELSTIERCLGPTHADVATALYNEFVLLDVMGSPREAEGLAARAIRIWRDSLGPEHPYLAFGLNGFGVFLSEHKRYARAREMFERALAIRRHTLGAEHPALAETLDGLAETLAATGQPEAARRAADEAIDILRRNPAWHPGSLANALEARAELETRVGNYMAARSILAEALAERERIFGATNPVTAATRADLAAADFALGADTDALASALDAESAGRTLLRFNARSLAERRALELASARPRGLDLSLSIAATGRISADQGSAVADAVIRSRGLVLDELAARARSNATDDPELAPLTAALAASRARFATLMMRAAGGEAVDAAVLDAARRAKENAEESVAGRSALARAELARAQTGLDDVRRSLPADAALVSFVRYERTTLTARGAQVLPHRAPSYMAIVLRGQEPGPVVVPLASAASVDAAIQAWRREIERGATAAGSATVDVDRQYRVAGSRLRRLLWDPLMKPLADSRRIFIVPDGAINTVSFDALPASSGGFLVEHAPVVHYLSTERDLVPGEAVETATGVLAVGGPEYGPSANAPVARASGCSTGPLQFEPLPASITEAREISRLAASDPTTILTGRAATKTAIARAAEGRRIVHLATHGFFLNSGCGLGASNRRGVGGLALPPGAAARDRDNPLLLAGLAFAGANRRSGAANTPTGLLTAEEVVSLNLQGTEWVVLSACDTGLGQVEAGEGVFGLRRAFQIAGAHTVIMSLWSVEDESTGQWMRALYDARFRQHMTTADAVRAATLRTLSDRRRRGLSIDPFYWAAFIAAGDWR